MTRLLAIDVSDDQGIALARQRTRHVAGLLKFDAQDQVRLATAVSEVARNAVRYAGGGRVEFAVEEDSLSISIRDRGPGIPDVQGVLAGHAGHTGGLGLINARRMVDELTIESTPGSTVVHLKKGFPRGVPLLNGPATGRIAAELAKIAPETQDAELQQQNRELLRVLTDLRDREARLMELNSELEATNKGVVALYAELDEKAESLRRASELKTRFLSNISHEFRTPLNSIISLTQFLLARTDGELTEEQERQVVFIRRAATSLSDLVNDLLDVAKVEAGKVTVRVERFAATDLFATLRGLMRPLLTNDAVSLTFDDVAAVGVLRTDEGKVAQILRNFLSNALKFTERGEVRATAEARPDGSILFTVSDTGIGIAPADQSRIFEEFGQVESTVQKRVKGTGLGLSLSRQLAELLGGRILVQSELGVGSSFFLSIPREYGPVNPSSTEASETTADALPILVIDDDEIARYLLRGLLDPTRYTVLEADGGAEGLRCAQVHHPCAIFLDLSMPDLSGFEVLDRLKGEPVTQDIPVIVYTSRVLDAKERLQLEGRVVTVLPKATGESHEAAVRTVRRALVQAGVDLGVAHD